MPLWLPTVPRQWSVPTRPPYKAPGVVNWPCDTAQAFRRFQWVPVRVEVELRKLQHQRPELGQLVPAPPPGAAGKLGGAGEKRLLLTGDLP